MMTWAYRRLWRHISNASSSRQYFQGLPLSGNHPTSFIRHDLCQNTTWNAAKINEQHPWFWLKRRRPIIFCFVYQFSENKGQIKCLTAANHRTTALAGPLNVSSSQKVPKSGASITLPFGKIKLATFWQIPDAKQTLFRCESLWFCMTTIMYCFDVGCSIAWSSLSFLCFPKWDR